MPENPVNWKITGMTALNEQHCSNDVEYTLRPKEPQSQTYLTSIDSDWQINLDEQWRITPVRNQKSLSNHGFRLNNGLINGPA